MTQNRQKKQITMKPLQGDSINVNSCSCTSCESRSESDRQTLKRLLVQGSKINKLLTGKYYVHLRETDLLDKLNKTRALYDALRSQLLSSNESSTADLKPRQSSREIRTAFVEAKKSSDIYALVDLVDKGAVLGSRKLSECCSCCTCSPKFRLCENVQKGRRNRLAYAGENIASRSSFVSKQETGEAKNIKSDPCTCACFKKEQIKKNRELLEKVCPAKSIVKRDYLSTPSHDLKLMSIKNSKLRKSYHKLKRAKAYPSPYMENIGEGGSKIVNISKLTSNIIKNKGSIELLKTTQNLKDNIETDRKVLQRKEPKASSTVKNTAEENMSRPNKTAIKLKDKVGGNYQVQSSKLKQRLAYRSRKINLPLGEITHIRDTSSTSSTSIPKEISFTTSHDRQNFHSRTKQHIKKHTLTESNTKLTEQPILNEESYSLKISNEVQHSKDCKIPSQKDPTDDAKKNKKMLTYSFTPGNELINFNIATLSVSSVKKRKSASHKKSSSNSFNKINKSNLKTRSSVLFRKRLLLSAPLYFRPRPLISEEPRQFEEPVRHKSPLHSEKFYDNCLLQRALRLSDEEPGRRKKLSKVKHKKNKSGSHCLKRCLCNIKIKINETKPRICKNVTSENLINEKQRIPSKSLLSSVETLTIASNDDPDMSDYAVKCEGSDYVTQIQAIKKNKQASQNEANAHFEIKYNSADSNESVEHSQAQDIFNKTKLSIHALISDCVCKEVEQFMYKYYGKPNINIWEKWKKIQDKHAVIDPSYRIVPKCECFDESIVTDEIGKSKDRGKSNTRLRIKSTLKDASITTEKPWKLHNQAVQTLMNSTHKTHKQKREKSSKRLEKKITYAANPRISMELLNTGYSNDDLKVTRSKIKCAYKCGEGSYQLLTEQSQTSTTTTKHNSPRIKNSEMLPPILKRNKTNLPDTPTHRIRQRKLYNNKRTSCLYCLVDKDNNLKQDCKILKNDTKNPQKIMLSGNTTTGKEQSLLLDLTNKPCLCTSKLRKKGKYHKKCNILNADTKSDKMKSGFQNDAMVTKCKYPNQLGKCKCNSDEYSESNKSNKQFQILTEKNKTKSESFGKQLRSTSKLLFVKSNFQQRKPSLQKFKKMQINSESSHQPQYAKDIYLDNVLKQNVRMASNFSFNIEFYKSVISENNYYQNRTKNIQDHCLNNKQESNFLTKRYSSSRLIHLVNKKVSPINKCFCTLEISKMDEQSDSKLISPFRTKKLTQVYAMSTVTIAENKIKTPEILKVDHNFHCIDSYHSTSYSKNLSNHIKHWQYFNKNPTCGFSISMIAFKAKNIQSYIRESKYKLLQIHSREQSLLDLNEAIRFESAFSCEVDYLKNICSKKQSIIRNVHSQNNSIAISQHNPLASQSQLTGIQPLLRRCYCTMNIQVARQKRKLLDYECEPGICIPGECDPYECQKLIMKRLMRKVSRMSGTDNRSKSNGNETSLTESRSRGLQSSSGRQPKYRTRGHYARSRPSPPQGLKYQNLPRSTLAPAHAHRQAVKVGSTFSFDIEFSKGSAKPTPHTTDVKVPTRHVSSRSSTTYHRRGMDRGTKHSGGRHHRETQSMMKQMRHRASSVTPMLKRCFCTLKLQKKGRQQKELELRTIHQGTSTPPKFDVEKPVHRTSERGQNTKRRRKFQELLPYECEPGICIPGECDPYECLELIKKRNKHTKDFGTDSMVSSTSNSSMTSGQKRKRKRIQARNIRPKQVRSSYTSVKSKPSVVSIDTIDRQGQDRQVAKPSRQAVKISSNFSFNIEFYKDQTGGSIVSDRRPSEVYVHKAPKEVRRVPKKVYAQRRVREGSSQSGTSSRDDDSQIGIFQRGQSTMTSGYVKRCFCTAKLQGYNIDAGTAARRPPSKLKRCFCTLKLLSKKHRIEGGGVGHERATSVAITQTRERGPPFQCVSDCEGAVRTQTKGRYSGLLPYECEPGVCDPDNCDPYECIKLIRKRLAKEKMTGTEGPRTRSTSSYFSSSNPSRAKMTQHRPVWPKTRKTQSRPARHRGRSRTRDYGSTESVVQEKNLSSVSPQRQAVRIGSNFSFNIEFYKDKGPNNPEVQMAAPVVKRYRRPVFTRDQGHSAYRRSRTRDRGLRGRRLPKLSRDTQMESIQSKDVGLGPILRRCFCTLKLQQKSKAKGKTKAVAKAASKAEIKAGSKAENKAGSKAENKAGSKAENKAGSKAENKAETSTETKTEVKAETKVVQKETDSQKQKKANHKCLCDQTNKKNECTCTPPIKEVATLHDKSITTSKKPKENIVAVKKTKENIMKRPKVFPYKLEPYECEPGICVPGECDPYECLKLINKRLMYSSGTSTDRRETRSSSNMAVCTNRDCGAQSYLKHKKKMRTRDTYTRHRPPWPRTKLPQPRTTRRRRRGRRRDYALSESVLHEKNVTSTSPQRQAVKIGSNFSFNIEFYKDKSPNNLEMQVSAPVVKRYRRPGSMRNRGHGAYRRTRTRDRGLRERRIPSLSRDSQMDSVQSRDVGLGPILKRCFCTLKLQQKSKAKGKTKVVAKVASKTESKAGSKAENKAGSKAENKAGSKAENKAGSKAENKAGSKAENKAETSTETKAVQKETDSQKQKKANHKCLCDQTNKRNECTCTPPVKEVATLHDKSITTSKKPKENIVAVKKTKENIMKRPKVFPYKLEPYECEPGICVPGECDPYECLKLINKRLMYSSGTSTDPRGTRSTSNMAVCTNRDCEAQSFIQRKKQMRTKHTYTRHRERRPHRDRRPHETIPHERRPHRERRPESRSSGFRSADVDKPTKQAVKIGSNFKFDIEFSKDKSNGGAVVTSKPIKPYVAYNKPRRTSSRSTEGPSIYYRNKKAQRYKANRDIDSQALGPSMRSTMTGTVAPFLKRCFCTLQLNCRTENQGTPFDCLVDIAKTGKLKSEMKSQVKPEEIQLMAHRGDKNKYSTKQSRFHDRKPCPKLLPYECEPGFCVPGECDPYECMKRIKKRMQSKQVGTIYRSRSFSSSTGEGKKYRPKRMQTRSSSPRRINVRTNRRHDKFKNDSRSRTISSSSDEIRKYRPRIKKYRSFSSSRGKDKSIRYDDQFQHDTNSSRQDEVVCDTKPKRQTVRIGSNFNFDIEFFKENSPQSPCKPQVNNITKKDVKKRWSGKRRRAKRLINTRTISSDERKFIRRRGARRATMTRKTSTKSLSSYGKKYNPRDIESQSEFKKTYSRGIGTPLLKRCFCTLKLEKKGKRRQFNTRKIEPTFKTSSKKMESLKRSLSKKKEISFKCFSNKVEPSFKCVSNKLEPTTKCVSTHTKSKTKAIIEPVAREIGTKPKTCECDKGRKGHKCKCNLNLCECKKRKKYKNCKCFEKCECVQEEPPPKKPSIFTCKPATVKEFPCKKGNECKCCKCNTYFMKTHEYRCKKGDICKCPICNTPALEPNEFPCKKGKNCKCCKCNTYSVKTIKYRCKKGEICKCPICNTPALEPNENIMNQNQNNIPIKQEQNFSPVNQDKCKCNKSKTKCKCNTPKRGKCLCEKVSQNIMPAKKDQNVISVKQEKFPCKKGKECKCCRCNPPGQEPKEFPCKKGKECKCCRCNPPGLEPNEYPCKKGIKCKCCKCNTFLKQNHNKIPTNQDNFPCKKGKECKCCTCNTHFMNINKYRCKKGEICKCPICNTPALEPNENKPPIKQEQNIIPVNQDTCRCNKSKNKCKCKQNKKNKNCKCFESCECMAQVPPPPPPPPPPAKEPSIPFTCKPSIPFTSKPSTQFTCKTANKKTSTKKKYDPSKQIDLRDDCGVCKSPYECLKRGIRRMYRPSGNRLKRRPRMSVSSIAATIVPGYTHKRTKYKGEPYSPDQIETVVEQPRFPFLHGKDARQGVKISSNFSFDIEFFKEMLPPVMDNVKKIDEDEESQQKSRTKNRIKYNYRAGDTRSARSGARDNFKYSNDSDSEPDRRSSPFEMLKKCFCTTKLQRSNYTQCLTVGRVQEIRPMSYFGPKEYLVQYQMQQQPTRKYFKTDSQELKTIMSYRPNKYNKVYNNKQCYCNKCFNRVNPTKQGAQCIPKQSEFKGTTLNFFFNIWKNFFTRRSNKINANKSKGWTELEKEATHKQPLIDILKVSKSERHPKRVATADIKKTKSLKVSKVSDVVYKKKYSRYQSGDHYKSQNTGIKFVKRNCRYCQNKLRQTTPVHDKVRFTALRTAKASHSKLEDPIVIGQKKDAKSVSFLFKSTKIKDSEEVQYLKVCSCCGGIKRIKNPLVGNYLGIKDKILEYSDDKPVIPKDLVGIAKTDKPEKETTLTQKNKEKINLDCRCCNCKSNSKQKAMQDKSGALSVSGNDIHKKEAERCAENMNRIECIENKSEKCICGTTICPSKTEIKVHALGSARKAALNQKERNKEPKQEVHICEILHTAECKEVGKTMKVKYKFKKLAKVKKPGTQLVTESVLDNQDELSETIGVSDPKSTYRKCQSYLRDHMHAWKKFQKEVFSGHGVETLRRLKLSCVKRKYVKGGTGNLENHPVTDVTVQFNNRDRKKGLRTKNPLWRRYSGSVFGWSPFMLSLRKRPWLSASYKCAGFFPHCLTILQVWRQFMDIVLFMLAAAAVSPCLLGIELCKALKSCFLCTA